MHKRPMEGILNTEDLWQIRECLNREGLSTTEDSWKVFSTQKTCGGFSNHSIPVQGLVSIEGLCKVFYPQKTCVR